MMLLTRRSKCLTILCALVQLVLPGALGVIDAVSAWEARGSVAHIEETAGLQCRAPHSDECIICRVLSSSATASTPSAGLIPRIACTRPTTSAAADPRSVSHRGFRSRAPPEALI